MLETCPTPDQLRRLLTDQLGEAQEDTIGDHVEGCRSCQESLERLTEATDQLERLAPSREDAGGRVAVVEDFLHALKREPPPGLFLGGVRGSGLAAALDGVGPLAGGSAPDGYEILGELGRGGTGVVYKARQHRLGRPVALKMLLAGAHAAPRELDRLRREAESIARLQHPNIVQIHEVGEHEGRPYLALEFVAGESLASSIAGSSQSARRSAELVMVLARAIHAAHRVGIIHRDLKPANVLLTESGVPKIADFGGAKRLDGESAYPTVTGQFLGTPGYMAPEQVVCHRPAPASPDGEAGITPAVDIYGLGAILYEMLIGRPPFHEVTPLESVIQLLHQEPVPPTRLRPSVPRDLETICLKCLEKSPARRYPTALELAEDLERFLDFEPVKARPVSAAERAWRWCLRNTPLAIATALAGAAIATTIGLSIGLAAYHYYAASRLGIALLEVQSQQRKVDQQAAHLAYAHGQAVSEQGDVAQGMLWLVNGLKSARLARDGDLERAFRRDLSGWWPRLHPLKVRFEHPGPIQEVAFSPDGRIIAVGGDDSTARLRNATTGEPTGPPFPHSMKVGAVAFSPDGRTLMTGCDDGVARLWDVKTGEEVGPRFRHPGPILAVAFGPDGRAVLTGSVDRTARVWDARTGEPIGRPMRHEDLVTAVTFSPDGRTALTGSWDRTARLWDAATGEPDGPTLIHADRVSSVECSPDGKLVLTGCFDRSARLWDRQDGHEIGRPLRHQHCVHDVAFSPDGKAILTGSFDGIARLWDAGTGNPIGPPIRHRHTVSSVAFAPDGRSVITAGFDRTVLISRISTAPGRSFSHAGFIRAVLFSPDGRTILSASEDHTARLRDAETGEPIGSPLLHAGSVEAIAFSPDGRTVLTGSQDATARLWDATTGEPIGSPLRHDDQVRAVSFSPDGRIVLTGSYDKTARLWDAATGNPIGQPMRHEEWVEAAAFSPDGRSIVTGSDDKTARIWDASDGRPLGHPFLHRGKVLAVAFSPDGRAVLTGSDDMKARLWDAATGRHRMLPLQHDGPVSVAAFSPDGRSVITGGWDRVARLWDARTGSPISPPLRHDGTIRALAISRDGRTVLTGSYDRTAQIWDAATGKPLGPAFRHENQVWFVAFSPDGQTILTGGQQNTAYLWDVPSLIDASIPEVERSIQVATGMELLVDGSLHVLDSSTWNERRSLGE